MEKNKTKNKNKKQKPKIKQTKKPKQQQQQKQAKQQQQHKKTSQILKIRSLSVLTGYRKALKITLTPLIGWLKLNPLTDDDDFYHS